MYCVRYNNNYVYKHFCFCDICRNMNKGQNFSTSCRSLQYWVLYRWAFPEAILFTVSYLVKTARLSEVIRAHAAVFTVFNVCLSVFSVCRDSIIFSPG